MDFLWTPDVKKFKRLKKEMVKKEMHEKRAKGLTVIPKENFIYIVVTS